MIETVASGIESAITGCILGTAVGDALGLPFEGMSRRRTGRSRPLPLRHRFLFGRGMISDDTEQTFAVAQSLIEAAGDVVIFRRRLARELKLWLAGLPAGVGWATLRAILRLYIGISPERSGVFSAGNGAAMRSALIGVCYGDDKVRVRDLVSACTRMTHTDPKAEFGALAVALAAYTSRRTDRQLKWMESYLEELESLLGEAGSELAALARRAANSSRQGQTTAEFAVEMGWSKGISGYVYQTVPVVLHAWFSHPLDYRAAVSAVIACGGDTDTTGAIVGMIVGAGVGKASIPSEWLDGLAEWPRSVAWMEVLSARLAESIARKEPQSRVPVLWPGVLLRNAAFTLIVLAHGFRRFLLW